MASGHHVRQRPDCHTFLRKFWHFQMAVSQWKLARLTPNLGILWISVCSFWLYESIVANPIIYRLVPRPSRIEIRQWNELPHYQKIITLKLTFTNSLIIHQVQTQKNKIMMVLRYQILTLIAGSVDFNNVISISIFSLIFVSLSTEDNVKHSRECFNTFSNTSRLVKNTLLCTVF